MSHSLLFEQFLIVFQGQVVLKDKWLFFRTQRWRRWKYALNLQTGWIVKQHAHRKTVVGHVGNGQISFSDRTWFWGLITRGYRMNLAIPQQDVKPPNLFPLLRCRTEEHMMLIHTVFRMIQLNLKR